MISMTEVTVDVFYQTQAITKQIFALFLDLVIYLFILVTLVALENNQESRLLTMISR